jgi:uncharacterized protein YbaR (Trm112 family)
MTAVLDFGNLALTMPADSSQSDSSRRVEQLACIVDQLACPACLGALRLDATALQCPACGRHYPIVDGIPVLIPTPPEAQ